MTPMSCSACGCDYIYHKNNFKYILTIKVKTCMKNLGTRPTVKKAFCSQRCLNAYLSKYLEEYRDYSPQEPCKKEGDLP